MITLPKVAKIAIETLAVSGYESYAVGGCVRDLGLGKVPYDIDITTNALPTQTQACFYGYKTVDIGKKYGTITVIIEGTPVEITTYRSDGEYKDNRKPNEVTFTSSLEEDLKRRDFTINALCYNDKTGLIDLFNGVNDLENGIIRPIGNAKKRFEEDALRILRAFRFMAQLGFLIEEDTIADIRLCKHLLNNISKERISSELSKIILSPSPSKTLYLMSSLSILDDVLPKLSFKEYSVLDHSKRLLPLRLALVYANYASDIKKIEEILKNLRFSNHVIKNTLTLITNKDMIIHPNDVFIKHHLNQFSLEGFILMIEFLESYHPEMMDDLKRSKDIIDRIISKQECYLTSDLKINGEILKHIGITNGIDIGNTLNQLLKIVYEDNSLNERKTLIKLAKEIMNSKEINKTGT